MMSVLEARWTLDIPEPAAPVAGVRHNSGSSIDARGILGGLNYVDELDMKDLGLIPLPTRVVPGGVRRRLSAVIQRLRTRVENWRILKKHLADDRW